MVFLDWESISIMNAIRKYKKSLFYFKYTTSVARFNLAVLTQTLKLNTLIFLLSFCRYFFFIKDCFFNMYECRKEVQKKSFSEQNVEICVIAQK